MSPPGVCIRIAQAGAVKSSATLCKIGRFRCLAVCCPAGILQDAIGTMKNFRVCLLLALTPHVLPAATGYLVHNLVADTASTASPAADFTDSRLVNAWGLAASATSPFWLCDAGSGLSTIYTVNATNATPLGTPNTTVQPTIPRAGGTAKIGRAHV